MHSETANRPLSFLTSMAASPFVSPLPASLHNSTAGAPGVMSWRKGPGRRSLFFVVILFFLVSFFISRQMVFPTPRKLTRVSVRVSGRVQVEPAQIVKKTPAQVPARKAGQVQVAAAKKTMDKPKKREKPGIRSPVKTEALPSPDTQLRKSEQPVIYSPRCEGGDRLCGRLSTECRHRALYDIMVAASARANQREVWAPQKNKYLLMHCRFGQISNLLRCMRSSLLIAGALNRTLLVPFLPEQFTFGYDLRPVWDLDHTRKCYGKKAVDTIHELSARRGEDIKLGEVVCFGASTCPIANRSLPVAPQLPNYEHLNVDPEMRVKEIDLGNYPPTDLVASEILFQKLRRLEADVVLAGEFFWIYFNDSDVLTEATLPFVRTRKCKSLMAIQPPPPILNAGKEFIERNLGERFVSIHLRRNSDFLVDCFRSQMQDDRWPHCTHSIRQLANFVARVLEAKGVSKVFLATDAKTEEKEAFVKYLKKRRPSVQVVTLSEGDSSWATELVAHGFQLRPKLELATVERVIAASAEVFLGTAHSTFSMEIERMRFSMKTTTWEDRFMCECEASEDKWDPDLQTQSDDFWKEFKV